MLLSLVSTVPRNGDRRLVDRFSWLVDLGFVIHHIRVFRVERSRVFVDCDLLFCRPIQLLSC
jgi:hypothetical protein